METPIYGERFIPHKGTSEVTYSEEGLIINPEDGLPLNGFLISNDGYMRVINGLLKDLSPFDGRFTEDNTIK